MRLHLICEFELADAAVRTALGRATTTSLIDDNDAEFSWPLIYDSETSELFVGDEGRFHTNLTEHPVAQGVYYGERPGVVGRVGIGLNRLRNDEERNLDLSNTAVIAFYENPDTDQLKDCVRKILSTRLVSERAFVIYADRVYSVPEFLGGEVSEATPEQIKRARLQIALHLGAWPNGTRLSLGDKRAIQQELGLLDQPVSTKRPWQRAAEQARLIQPGQKWWAPTSEGLNADHHRNGSS